MAHVMTAPRDMVSAGANADATRATSPDLANTRSTRSSARFISSDAWKDATTAQARSAQEVHPNQVDRWDHEEGALLVRRSIASTTPTRTRGSTAHLVKATRSRA